MAAYKIKVSHEANEMGDDVEMSERKRIKLDKSTERYSFFMAGITNVSVASSVVEHISKLSEDQVVAKKGGLLKGTRDNDTLNIYEISSTFPEENEDFPLGNKSEKWWGIFSFGDHPNEKDVEALKITSEPFLLFKHSSSDGPPVMSMYEVIYNREKELISLYQLMSCYPEKACFYIRGNAPLSGELKSILLENIPENSPLKKLEQINLNYEIFREALDHNKPVYLPDLKNFRQKFSMKSGGNVNCRKYFWHVVKQNNFPPFFDYNVWIHDMKWVIRWWNGTCSPVNQGDKAEEVYDGLIRWEINSWNTERDSCSPQVQPCTDAEVAKLKLSDESSKKERCSFHSAGINKVLVVPSVIEHISKISEDEAITKKGGMLRARKENEMLEIFDASSNFPAHHEAFSPGDKFENKKWWGIFSHGEHPNEKDVEILKTCIFEPFLLLKHTSSDGSPLLFIYEVVYNKEKGIMSFYELVSFDHPKTCFYVRGDAPLSGATYSDLLNNIQENSPLQKIKEMYQNYEDFERAFQSRLPRLLPTLEELYEKLSKKSVQLEKDLNFRKYFRQIVHEEHFAPALDYSFRMERNIWDCEWWHKINCSTSASGGDAGEACKNLIWGAYWSWKLKTAPYTH